MFSYSVINYNYAGDVHLHSPAARCGKPIYCSCIANKTNVVSIGATQGNVTYGSHTFERGSDPQASFGPLQLYMVKAKKDSSFSFLTNFEIKVRHNTQDSLNITCFDVSTTEQLVVPSKFESRGSLQFSY